MQDFEGRSGGAMPGAPAMAQKFGGTEADHNEAADDLGEGEKGLRLANGKDRSDKAGKLNQGPAGEPEPAVARERKDFRDTAFFEARVQTDETGRGTIRFRYPDNLTTWRITVRGATAASQVGEGRTTTLVTKKILVRLATPRFFTERDEVALTTLVHNEFDEPQAIEVQLALPEALVPIAGEIPAVVEGVRTLTRKITVEAHGVARQDWRVRVAGWGPVSITATALSAKESDRVTLPFEALRHGYERWETQAGSLTGGDLVHEIAIDLPESFDPAQTSLRVGLAPSVATACVDAIPYLIRYPYGCIEQTMSRFLPAVVVRGTLQEMGVDLEEVRRRRETVSLDGLDRGSINMFRHSAVFDPSTLDDVLRAGLGRIRGWQNGDGGWGWFKGFSSDPGMTAYVVHGLTLARAHGVDFDDAILTRGLGFLGRHFLLERNLHQAAFIAYALAPHHNDLPEAKKIEAHLTTVFERRADLNHLSRAYLALALHESGRHEEAQLLVENMEDYGKRDAEAGTAYWKTSSDGWWYWYNNALETNTAVLRALAAIAPDHPDVGPLARWVLNHRQGNRWESTKGTSLAILALIDVARERGELEGHYTLEIAYSGKTVETIEVTPETLLSVRPSITLSGEQVAAGDGRVTFTKRGEGTLLYAATLSTYDTSEATEATGYEIFLERRYFKLTPTVENEEATDGSRRQTYERTELSDGDAVESGDLVEVVLAIDAKNDYDHVLFEDPKPAGFEATSQRSGYSWADGLGVFMEFRDERVAIFASRVPQGKHTLTYRLRAETPGTFHALPARSEAMYAPLVRASSAETRLGVTAAKE